MLQQITFHQIAFTALMQTLTVSRSHFSHLNQLIHTQHRILKMRLVGTDEAPQLQLLFNQWRDINAQMDTLYHNLEMGTILLEDHLEKKRKETLLVDRIREIEQVLHNIQMEKHNLETTVEAYKKQCNEQTLTISKQGAELNKLSTQKQGLSERVKELREKVREAKDLEEIAKNYKRQLKVFKEKAETLQEKCELLERLTNRDEVDIGEELDRELESLGKELD